MNGWGNLFRVSGLGRQVPGTGVQVRVQVQDLNFPVPVPVPDNPYLRPEGRDLGPENGLFDLKLSRHPPPGAATCHPRMKSTRTARGAAPTSIQLCRDAVPTLPIASLVNRPTGQRVN